MVITRDSQYVAAGGDTKDATASQFMSALENAKGRVGNSLFEIVKREGRERIIERQRSGRGDSPLDFSDLIEKLEKAMSPK